MLTEADEEENVRRSRRRECGALRSMHSDSIDFRNTIHFARDGLPSFRWSVFSFRTVILVCFIGLVGLQVDVGGRYVGLLTLLILGTAATASLLAVRRRAEALRELAPLPDERYRLRCVGGTPGEIITAGEMRASGFPPIVMRAYGAVPFSMAMRIVTKVMWVILTAASFLLNHYLLRADVLDVVPSFLLGAWALAYLLVAAGWQTYLRFSPGWLEVLRYGCFGLGAAHVERIDLRTCRILVDLGRRFMVVEEPARTRQFELPMMRGRFEMARSVFLSARSSAIVPTLPRDTLVG